MEEKNKSIKRKPNTKALVVIALVIIVSLGIYFALDRFLLQEPAKDITEDRMPSAAAEPIPDDSGYVDRPIDASANLHLDIRREASPEAEAEEDLSDRQIYFAGVGDDLLAYDTEIALENLPENEDFMMKYVITDLENGTTVFETGLIPSGECVKWTPGHSLGEGEHHLNFHIAPYYPKRDQYLPLTSANNEVVFTIGGM